MTKRDLDLRTEIEKTVLNYLQMVTAVSPPADHGDLPWVHRSTYHLLLQHGRFFIPTPHPPSISKMPDRLCYQNATATAHARRSEGLLYAEGFATPAVAHGLPLEHAWCVTPDGTVLDPTWHDDGVVYFGVAVADPAMWPTDGAGLLSDFQRCLPLLRDGLPTAALADIGRHPQQRT